MADRDIPSVPVTTLAGLTSLSDLLSELPISESSVITSLHKSLLFHPRVAEEANNLLSTKDDNLARQLVQAIEQTNADHIELKSQYAEVHSSGTNINELPQLLQGIHNLKPTVYKTGTQQQQQRQIFQPLMQPIQPNVHHPTLNTQNVLPAMQFCPTGIPGAPWNPMHQPHTIGVTSNHIPSVGGQFSSQNMSPSTSSMSYLNNAQSPSQSASIKIIQKTSGSMQTNNSMPMPLVSDVVVVKQEFQPIAFMGTADVPVEVSSTVYQHNTLQPSHQQSSQQQPIQQLLPLPHQRPHQQQHQQLIQQPQQHQKPLQPPPVYPQYQPAFAEQQQHTQPVINNLPMAKSSQAFSSLKALQSTTTVSQNNISAGAAVARSPVNNRFNSNSVTLTSNIRTSVGVGVIRENSSHKLFPRNNNSEQMERRGGPSPAQASDAPAVVPSAQFTTAIRLLQESKSKEEAMRLNQIQPPDTPNHKGSNDLRPTPITHPEGSTVKVTIRRLKEEDSNAMQTSLEAFSQNSPQLARKYGILPNGGAGDMFTQMKASERSSRKRQSTDDIIKFTQPKLRKIMNKSLPSLKSSKDDVLKSQTYQQFMKSMDHELRRLEETEQPNNADDMDYYSDCIPSKVLAQLTNDVAKLKAKGVVDAIPKNKLTLLINFAMRNVDISKNMAAGPDMDDDDFIDRILDAAEACLLVSNIYATANDVKFLQEDNMEKIVKFVQFQMRETIFPSYDPVFSVKSMKKNKKKSSGLSRSVQLLYTKLVELTKIFVTLFDNCSFVDTIVLAVSSLAVEPVFVDNIETMQFACLELVTTIFRKENYVKYRSSILCDILTSVDRLPCSKKNLRPYKLANNGGSIQLITALVLQLIQCSSVLPGSLCDKSKRKLIDAAGDPIDPDLLILEKCDTAFNIGGNFLTTFLNKCKSRSGETDFRPLFENFIYDLLTTVNKPEWPASELLLSQLGTLLVKYMSDKTIEQAIRVVSLEYLGIVAARLRKDTVESRCKVNTMDALIKCIKQEQRKEGDNDGTESKIVVDPEEERTEFLQKILLDFLAVNAQEDNLIWDYARHFYLTQWYKDVIQRKKKIADGEKGYASRKKNQKKKTKYKSDSESSADDEDDSTNNVKGTGVVGNVPDQELNLEIFRILDERKRYFIKKIKPSGGGGVGGGGGGGGGDTVQDIRTYIDYSNAYLIAQYLASKRQFSQSFDRYLQKIILVVREPSIAIRTKAMKCLAMIVEVDPSILKRNDMKMGVSQKLLDTSISVREAAVDLVGKYVLSSPDLIDQYYEMLSMRILDTGVSVRKRVIKILRDICIEYPDFDKIPEICVKMIRRVHDEEGIQKLVTEVFMRMWFTPCADTDQRSIERKTNQMTEVVSMAYRESGTQWLDGLLKGIFAPKEEKDVTERNPNAPKKEPPKEVIKACQQLTDGLVNAIIRHEGGNSDDQKKVLASITTLNLLSKVRPQLLVKHAITLEPYLNVRGHLKHIVRFVSYVAEILEQVVPLMEHPSESFLADLETHLMMLVCSHNQSVVNSCMSCLGAIVNKITKNYKLIRDCFSRCLRPVLVSRNQLEADPNFPLDEIFKPSFRRGLFTIGLIFRNFDFKSPLVYGEGLSAESSPLPSTICSDVFDHLVYFSTLPHNDIRRETLIALGHFCIKNYEYLTNHNLRNFYCDLLSGDAYPVEVKTIVLRNISMYLQDADQVMSTKDNDWKAQSLVENLSEMGDVMSGMASCIIQLYLDQVLQSLLHRDYAVRLTSMKVVQEVLRQGLVHPVKIVPYLICLSTDDRKEIAHRSDVHLQEIDKQYTGFVSTTCLRGIQLSFELQRILQRNDKCKYVRGYCVKVKDEQPTALNGYLYTLMRSTKPQRRALVQSITKQFEEQHTTLQYMLYLADNLAYFPYLVQDEPLFIIHRIDLFISNTGTNILHTFKENLIPLPAKEEKHPNQPVNALEDEDDDEDLDSLLVRIPLNSTELQKCMISAQGCILLLMLKQHLKTCYRITEGKISRYSPSEAAKVYEKAMQRHPVSAFDPKPILAVLLEESVVGHELIDNEKKELIERYLDFKQLMLKIDKEESDNDSDRPVAKSVTNTPAKGQAADGSASATLTGNGGGANVYINNSASTPNMPVFPNKENAPTNNSHISVTPPGPQHQNRNHTPKSTTQRSGTKRQSQSHSRKQPIRSKRKKRNLIQSSEDSDSDDDYS